MRPPIKRRTRLAPGAVVESKTNCAADDTPTVSPNSQVRPEHRCLMCGIRAPEVVFGPLFEEALRGWFETPSGRTLRPDFVLVHDLATDLHRHRRELRLALTGLMPDGCPASRWISRFSAALETEWLGCQREVFGGLIVLLKNLPALLAALDGSPRNWSSESARAWLLSFNQRFYRLFVQPRRELTTLNAAQAPNDK